MLYKNGQKFGNLKFLSIHFELLKYTNLPFPIGPGGFGIEITHPQGFPNAIPHPHFPPLALGDTSGPHILQPRGTNTNFKRPSSKSTNEKSTFHQIDKISRGRLNHSLAFIFVSHT